MNVAVTGAAGRLGSLVCQELTARGHHVTALDAGRHLDPGTELRIVDLRDELAVRHAFAGVAAVVHLGNHTTYTKAPAAQVYQENVAMNYNVALGAIAAGAKRFIFASSVQATSGESERAEPKFPSLPLYHPADGNLPTIPRNPYSLSKEAGEQMLQYLTRTHGFATVAIRYPYLAHTRSDVPAAYHQVQEYFAWLSYRDGARLVAAILGAELPGFRAYFPASRHPANGRSVAENLRDSFNTIPARENAPPVLVDCSRIEQDTGWIAQD